MSEPVKGTPEYAQTVKRLIILWFAVWAVDLVINFINSAREAYVPAIEFDKQIPFIPESVYFYSLYFFLVTLPFFFVGRVLWQLRRYVHASLVVMIVSYIIYLAFPTRLVRLELSANDVATGFTLIYHYLVAPVNLLPSMHVSMLILAFLALYGYSKTIGLILATPIFLSIISVVLTKQHYVMDFITAVPLAIFAWVVARRK